MKINSLTELEKLSENNLFDLTTSSFKPIDSPYIFSRYVVSKGNEMRIDLICEDIYDSTDYVDFLLYFNGFINPFNITEGTVILYVSPDIIPQFYAPKENEEEVQQVFLNKSKVKRRDKNRDQYNEEKRSSLPPTVTDVKNEQVKIKGNSVIIGGDIFNV